MYRVEVAWVPAFELLTSVNALVSRGEHKTMDLGTLWVHDVRKQIGPELAARISSEWTMDYWDLAHLAALTDNTDRPVDDFLEWFAARSREELYTWVGRRIFPKPRPFHVDILLARDAVVDLLSSWNDSYFRHVDPDILDGLRREREEKAGLIDRLAPIDLVETATNGVCFEPLKPPETVVLIPQWHFRPWNVYADFGSNYLLHYPADVLPGTPGAPPLSLLRLARALGDESRLRILRSLAEHARTFTELVKLTGLSKSTVSHHMVILRAAGLITVHVQKTRGDSYTLRLGAIDELDDRLRTYLNVGDMP